MLTVIVLLHSENIHHQGLNYEILFVDYPVNFKQLPEIRDSLYCSLKKYFKTDYLPIIQILNTITFFCFPPPQSGDRWQPYGKEFTEKIKDIENKLY